MNSLNQIIAELEDFATAHWQIHTFGHGDVWEISPQSSGIVYPVLWMVPQTATPTLNEVVDEFTVLCMDLVDSGERNETEVLSDTRQIILDVCAYYRQTHTNAYIIEFGGSIQPFTERDPERVSGHSLTIRIKQPHDYNLCAVPANAVPVPPIPSCADATVQNAASNPTYQASVASGGALVLPQLKVLDSDGVTPILANYIPNTSGFAVTCSTPTCADATITVNTAPFGTAPSGGGLNVPVVNQGANAVGSIIAGEVVVANNSTFINGTQVTDQEAEIDANIFVTLDGAQSGTWNNGTQTWEVTSSPCPPVAGVTISLSDTTPEFDSVVTVTATATGITATSYTFYLPSYDGKMEPVTQVSNVYLWTVREVGNWTVRVSATDGASTGYGTTSGSTIGDINASAFISAHNTATGLTMDTVQQDAVIEAVLGLKGVGLSFSDRRLWETLVSGSARWPMYCPVSDSVANAAAYSMELFTAASGATFTAFVAGNFSPNGLTGGAGKSALFNVSPSTYPQNGMMAMCYNRTTSPASNGVMFGSATGTDVAFGVATYIQSGPSNNTYNGTTTARNAVVYVANKGVCGLVRISSGFVGVYTDRTNRRDIAAQSMDSASPPTVTFRGHAGNGTSGAHRESNNEYCGFLFAPCTDISMWDQVSFVFERFQASVITGGRNV